MPHNQDNIPPDALHDPPLALSDQDKQCLQQFNKKLQVLRDRVEGVARGYQAGLIITGRGGIGKSYSVIQELERIGVPFELTNSHLTPRALFDLLYEQPDTIHVIEDAEEVVRNKTSLGVLRSAFWGSVTSRLGRSERRITWKSHRVALEVCFDGGIILILNRPLSDLPEAKALATRAYTIDLCVSDQEIAAMMRKVASMDYKYDYRVLAAPECTEVANFIISESKRLNRTLDMRLLINAFRDRLQEDACDSGCSWRDLVYSALRGKPAVMNKVAPIGLRQKTKARELEIARGIVSLEAHKRLEVWQLQTGKSQAAMYRRLAELGKNDAQDFDF